MRKMAEKALFENTCAYTQQHLLEMGRKTTQVFRLVLLIACLLFVALGVWEAIAGVVWRAVVSFVFALVWAYLLVVEPPMNAKRAYKRYWATYHAEVQTRNLFFDDHILGINEQSGGEMRIPYDQIVKIHETPNLYLLMLPKRMLIMVDKNGFQSGAADAFVPWLRKKCPRLSR